MSTQLTDESYAHAAWFLRCDVPAIKAVAEVEAGSQGAFLKSGQPVILFEPHIFSRLTGGKHDGLTTRVLSDAQQYPISYPKWRPGAYGPTSIQHERLDAAVAIDRSNALMSASWGLFQILGSNYRRAGFESIQEFVNGMMRDADSHLRAFVNFVASDAKIANALRAHDWQAFALRYNGPGYVSNKYDTKMAAAFARHAMQQGRSA